MIFKPDPKKPPKEKKKKTFLKRVPLKKVYKATGELELFKKIFIDRGRRCQVTGNRIFEFDVNCFAHILAKKPYKKFILNPANILLVEKEFHHLYDHDDKSHVLRKYPQAEFVWQLKQQLKTEYNQLHK